MGRRSWVVAGVGMAVVIGIPLLRSGTLTPCGMVEFEVRRALADETTRQLAASSSNAEVVGTAIGAALVDRLVQQWMGGKGPADCIVMLGRIIWAGGVKNMMAAAAASRRAADEKAAAEDAKAIEAATIRALGRGRT